jgi:hypothetical protein
VGASLGLNAITFKLKRVQWLRENSRHALFASLIKTLTFPLSNIFERDRNGFLAPRFLHFKKWPSHLPQTLNKIAFYLPNKKGISISKYLAKRLGKAPTEHSWVVVEEGNLLGISWLHYHRISGNVKLGMEDAAEKGYLEVVQWLHKNRSEGCTEDAMDWAAQNGSSMVTCKSWDICHHLDKSRAIYLKYLVYGYSSDQDLDSSIDDRDGIRNMANRRFRIDGRQCILSNRKLQIDCICVRMCFIRTIYESVRV